MRVKTPHIAKEKLYLTSGHLPVLYAESMSPPMHLPLEGKDKADKEQLKERIPPRTYHWLDEYFLCRQCGKLFWHGTHWERIRARLEQMRQRLAR